MKKTITLAVLLISACLAKANPIEDKHLVSWNNYGMEALEVKNISNGLVQIIVAGAILHYADNRPMIDRELENKMKNLLGLKGNVLIITFKKDDCLQNSKLEDVFDCRTVNYPGKSSVARVQSGVMLENGTIKLSPKSIDDVAVQIQTQQITEIYANGLKHTTLRARVGIESLDLLNIKNGLGKKTILE